MLTKVLVAAAIAWPLVAGGAVWHRASHPDGGQRLWATAVYLAGSRICHQIPGRSFATRDVQWPVCARCSGLYLGAPFGVLALVAWRRKFHAVTPATPHFRIVAFAAIPTVLTLVWEWGGMGTPSSLIRFTTALPLGAAIMRVLLQVTGTRESIG